MPRFPRFAPAVAGLALTFPMLAHASGWPVFDAANFLKNTITAVQAVKTEAYQNSNIIYQYQLLANQLKQATGLDPVTLIQQLSSVQSDIKKQQNYGQALDQLYGSLSQNVDFLQQVNGLISQSGKTPSQWFADQRTLLNNGDQTAKRLFSLGTDIVKANQANAERRQQIQQDMQGSETAQATAQTTNRLLDLVAGQNSDMLQLVGAKLQSDAIKDQKANTAATAANDAAQQLQSDRDAQRQKLLDLTNVQ